MLNLAPLLQYVQGRIPASEDLAQRELRAFETSTESKKAEDSNSNDDDGETGSEDRRTPSSGMCYFFSLLESNLVSVYM